MKRALIIISVLILTLTVFVSCSKDEPPVGGISDEIPETYSMTEPQYTVGADETSQKVETGEDSYEIFYFDDNGFATKLEVYRKGKLRYYYTASSVDEEGNCVQQKYYTPKGELIGTYDNGFFFDGNGKQISEDRMQYNLEQYQ